MEVAESYWTELEDGLYNKMQPPRLKRTNLNTIMQEFRIVRSRAECTAHLFVDKLELRFVPRRPTAADMSHRFDILSNIIRRKHK